MSSLQMPKLLNTYIIMIYCIFITSIRQLHTALSNRFVTFKVITNISMAFHANFVISFDNLPQVHRDTTGTTGTKVPHSRIVETLK